MRVEVLFPEIANLYGELGNIKYLEKSVPDIYVKETSVNEKPAFLDSNEESFDLVYMGTMSESSQLLVMEKLAPYREEIISSIENGQRILVTGNALEIWRKAAVSRDFRFPHGKKNDEAVQLPLSGKVRRHRRSRI